VRRRQPGLDHDLVGEDRERHQRLGDRDGTAQVVEVRVVVRAGPGVQERRQVDRLGADEVGVVAPPHAQ
jgi:hypothetical protein